MATVISNEAGQYYAGYQADRPVWFRSCREECIFSDALADKILSQLIALGYTGVEKKPYSPHAKKKYAKKAE